MNYSGASAFLMVSCSMRVACMLLLSLLGMATSLLAQTNEVRTQTGVWDVSIGLESDEILAREPLGIRIGYRNITQKTQVLSAGINTVTLRREGWGKDCELFVTSTDERSDSLAAGALVEPGATCDRKCWLSLGRTKDLGRKWEFLFDASGKYQIAFPEFNHASVEIEVVAPFSREDVAAYQAFSVPAASLFMGETSSEIVNDGMRSLEAICRDMGKSRYAPYAAMAMAETMWRTEGGFKVNIKEYKRYLDLIIERKPEHKMKGEALFLLARGYAFQKGKKLEVKNVLDRLSKEHSDSPYIKRIESSFGVTLGERSPVTKEQPKAHEIKPATLRIEGSSKIPDAPRVVYEDYWKALAGEMLDDAEKYLHSDFVSSQGGRRGWRLQWEKGWGHSQLDAIEVSITRAESVPSFSLPESLMTKGVTWTGEVCLVFSQTSYSMTDRGTGARMNARPNRPAITALLKEGDNWRIISEYSEPTRNGLAGLLAQKLSTSLVESLQTVNINDGTANVSIVDKIRAVSPTIRDDQKLGWRFLGIEMHGDAKDQPVISGDVYVLGDDRPSGNVICRVSITTKLDGDRLVLIDVQTVNAQ